MLFLLVLDEFCILGVLIKFIKSPDSSLKSESLFAYNSNTLKFLSLLEPYTLLSEYIASMFSCYELFNVDSKDIC